MPSELIIRPGRNDQDVVADLLAPGGGAIYLPTGRPVISRILVDAHIVAKRPRFAEAAREAGIPLVVDPLTHLWQGRLRAEDAWAKLPFGQPHPLSASDLAAVQARESLVARVVDFQVEHGATAVVPPYPYAASPGDPWFHRALQLIRATARYMNATGTHLPLIPVLCASLQGFGPPKMWSLGLDRFAQTAVDVGPQLIAVCFSPVSAKDSYSKVHRMFGCFEHLRRGFGRPVLAWRQGFFGPGLVAAGAAGYETGIATSEFCDMARTIRSRRPPKDGQKRSSGGSPLGVYVEPLGRTLPARAGEALLSHTAFAAKVMCDDERCCPHGVETTLNHRREHAVRTRARVLAALDALPHRTWQLHQVGKDAKSAVTLATQANRILEDVGVRERVQTRGMESMARVVQHIRAQDLDLEAA